MKTRGEHIEFIRLNLVAISSCAWHGYETAGRGLVCVLCDERNEMMGTVPFDYMKASDAQSFFSPWRGSKEERMVCGYDPSLEVVVAFVASAGPGVNFDSYRFRTIPAPPLAAEM